MATIYFSSNADSGDGTLRYAIASAESGDTITYDPNVFTSGPVVIPLSSALIATINKTLTIDGGELGIVLDGQQTNIACISLSSGSPAITLVNFTIKRFNRTQNAPIYLNGSGDVLNLHRCKIIDNQNNYFGAIYILNGTVNLYDSLVCGNNSKQSYSTYAGGIRLGENGYLNLVRSTVVFNTNANVYGGLSRQTRINSFIGFTPYNGDDESLGDIEYVNPPGEAHIPFGDWTEGIWQNYDFRLKPTSPYLTGATYQPGDLDLLGHARTGSWGAYDGSWLVARAAGSATVSASVTVDYCELASTGALTLAGSDVIVTVTKEASLAAGASVSSTVRGYLVVPSGTSSTGVTLSNVVITSSGADALTFSATTTTLTWTATDSTKPVVLEYQNAGAWVTIAETTGTSYTYSLPAGTSVRLFDGVDFLSATVTPAPTPPPGALDFHSWGVYDATITVEASVPYYTVIETARAYETTTEYILMSVYYNRGESPLLFARITDSATGAIIDPTSVSGITYTCYKLSSGWGIESRTPVTDHEDVTVPTTALLVTDDNRWTIDTVGYNFIFEPDSRTAPIFPDAGEYVVVVTISFSNANPIPLSYNVSVN